MSYDLRQFIVSVLHGIGAPITDANILALTGWHACEGGSASYNPLNTTLWQPGATDYNSFGPGGAYHVRNYPSVSVGVHATVLTLENGHYPHIVGALRDGSGHIAAGPASHELDVWGTGGAHVAAWLAAHHAGTTPPAHRPAGHPHHATYTVRAGDTLSAIATRYHLHSWEELYTLNRHTIGDNPNRIRPGERLTIPN